MGGGGEGPKLNKYALTYPGEKLIYEDEEKIFKKFIRNFRNELFCINFTYITCINTKL